MQDAIAWRWSEDPEQKRWMDWKTDWTHHDKAKAMGYPVEYAVAQSALNEPGKVYHAMLRGEIPKLTWRQMVHLSGPVPNTADEALAEIVRLRSEVKELKADPVPAPAVPNEIGLGKGEFVIWPVKLGGVHGLAFVKTNDPKAVGAFHAEPEDGQIELGAGDSVIHFGNAESAMVLAERLQYVIALLQSAEVRHD